MVQRKDTPAARAALARRRQRAAQSLRKPSSAAASAPALEPRAIPGEKQPSEGASAAAATGGKQQQQQLQQRRAATATAATVPSPSAGSNQARTARSNNKAHRDLKGIPKRPKPPPPKTMPKPMTKPTATTIESYASSQRQPIKRSNTSQSLTPWDEVSSWNDGARNPPPPTMIPKPASASVSSDVLRHRPGDEPTAGKAKAATGYTAATATNTIGGSDGNRGSREASRRNHESVMERSRIVSEESSLLIRASLSRLQPPQEPPQARKQHPAVDSDVSANSSVGQGEHYTETVSQDGIVASTDISPSARSQTIHYKHEKKQEDTDEQEQYESPEKFERISSFGYIERTSPQPKVRDRRNLSTKSFIASPNDTLRHDVVSASQSSPSANNNNNNYNNNDNNKELQLPSFGMSHVLTLSSNDHNNKVFIDRDHLVRRSSSEKDDHDSSVMSTTPPHHRTKTTNRSGCIMDDPYSMMFPTSPQAAIEDTRAAVSEALMMVGETAAAAASDAAEALTSMIPSLQQSIQNPSGFVLPRRSHSPRRTISPEKRPSPRRFRAEKDSGGSPRRNPTQPGTAKRREAKPGRDPYEPRTPYISEITRRGVAPRSHAVRTATEPIQSCSPQPAEELPEDSVGHSHSELPGTTLSAWRQQEEQHGDLRDLVMESRFSMSGENLNAARATRSPHSETPSLRTRFDPPAGGNGHHDDTDRRTNTGLPDRQPLSPNRYEADRQTNAGAPDRQPLSPNRYEADRQTNAGAPHRQPISSNRYETDRQTNAGAPHRQPISPSRYETDRQTNAGLPHRQPISPNRYGGSGNQIQLYRSSAISLAPLPEMLEGSAARPNFNANPAQRLESNDTNHTEPSDEIHVDPIKQREGRNRPYRKFPRGNREGQDVDVACLHSGDSVMLQSCSLSATLQMGNDGILAEFNGPCLGNNAESLRIFRVEDDGVSPLMEGDVVYIELSGAQQHRALGVRKRCNDTNAMDEIGFFGDGSEESDLWIIRSAKAGTELLVGKAAVAGKSTSQDAGMVIPVRSGSSILLMNCSNGGLLSIRNGVPVLRTDSYDPNTTPFSGDPSLLGSLGRHDKLEPSVRETFQLLKSFIPPCPSWAVPKGMGERLFLNGSYLSKPLRNQKENISVKSNLSSDAKENILVDEIIGSFLGLEGLYIRLKGSEGCSLHGNLGSFQLFDSSDVTFDLSLRNLVDKILPLSTSYICVQNFVGSHYPGYEYGRVMQAFCEGLDTFLQQFVSFVAQLDQKIRKPPSSGAFTMKNIHFEITPLLHSMSILKHTTEVVFGKKGGALINALRSLEKRVYMGDTVAKDLFGTLLDRASAPYAEMLSIWLQSGRLVDPYDEFMIEKTSEEKDNASLDGDTWSALFAINEEHVVGDIVRNQKYKNMILVTGKYWNAVQACTVDTMNSVETQSGPLELKKLQFQSDSSQISSYIDSMYKSASGNLMNILKHEYNLRESLQVMKRYFLLDQGDFLVNFLEAAEEELAKPFENVSIGRVQHFLGISVQATESQKNDDFDSSNSFRSKNSRQFSPNGLRCRLAKHSLVSYLDSIYGGIEDLGHNTPSKRMYSSTKQGMAGFDYFEIEFPRVPFPISLIISPTSMESYKMLFRHLFFAKHVERRMVAVWCDHQVLKKLDALRGLLGPTFLLRQRMLHFVQNLMNYMTFEVVESNWLEMLSAIDASEDSTPGQTQQTVDDLLKIHDGFLHKTIQACLLQNPPLIKTLIKLLNTCLLFSDQMKRFIDSTKIHDDSFNTAIEKRDAVQRNLNERRSFQPVARDQNKLRRALVSVKEERAILLQRQTRRVGREICSDSYKKMVRRFDEVFSTDLSAFVVQLRNSRAGSGTVANLGMRLDWNGFVSRGVAVRNRSY